MRFCKISLTKRVLRGTDSLQLKRKTFSPLGFPPELLAYYARSFSAPACERKKGYDEIAHINVASPRWWAPNEIHECFETAKRRSWGDCGVGREEEGGGKGEEGGGKGEALLNPGLNSWNYSKAQLSAYCRSSWRYGLKPWEGCRWCARDDLFRAPRVSSDPAAAAAAATAAAGPLTSPLVFATHS